MNTIPKASANWPRLVASATLAASYHAQGLWGSATRRWMALTTRGIRVGPLTKSKCWCSLVACQAPARGSHAKTASMAPPSRCDGRQVKYRTRPSATPFSPLALGGCELAMLILQLRENNLLAGSHEQ